MLLLLHALASFGCTGSGDASAATGDEDSSTSDTDTGHADSGDTDVSGETAGTCEGYGAGEGIAFESVYGGDVYSGTYARTVEARVFDTEADWLAFIGGVIPHEEVGVIDFATQRVAAGFVVVPSTCGLVVGDVAVTQAPGEVIHVDFTVHDTSGGCDTVCLAVGEALVAVAVPRDDVGLPTVCTRRVDDGC